MIMTNNIPNEFLPFWQATREGHLNFPKCDDCGRFHWYPHKLCPFCQSNNIRWVRVKGRGKIFSWTVVRYPFDPSFSDQIPYIVAAVVFEDAPGVRLVTNIIDIEPDQIEIGMEVENVFRRMGDTTLAVFRPISIVS